MMRCARLFLSTAEDGMPTRTRPRTGPRKQISEALPENMRCYFVDSTYNRTYIFFFPTDLEKKQGSFL